MGIPPLPLPLLCISLTLIPSSSQLLSYERAPCAKIPSLELAICESAIPPRPSSPALKTPAFTPGESPAICATFRVARGKPVISFLSTVHPRVEFVLLNYRNFRGHPGLPERPAIAAH